MAEEVKAEEAAAAMEVGGEVPQITAGDLATMVRVIDAGSQRGAFKGEEMETVGALRNKLAVVVNALAPKTEETEAEAEAEAEGGEEETAVAADDTGDESVA